ncbi:MAG: hypothetical protein O2816_18100 [Planctomycetota bacterium]|nr:hypothetical protein [Planctomycetota bacterium]
MRATTWTYAATAAMLLAVAAPADTLLTKDGRVIDGPKMERTADTVVIHFENGKVTVPMELVKDVFLESDTEELPKGERRRIEKQLEEDRARVLESQLHKEWRNRYEVKTKNFIWQYTLPDHIGQALQTRFETYFDHFKKLWRIKINKRDPRFTDARLPVNFYRTAAQYQQVAGASPGALAFYRFVKPVDLNAFYDRIDPEGTEMVLYHELSHHMQHLVEENFTYPHWPGEGVAEYYGASLYREDKKKLDIGLSQDGRLAEVKNDVSLDKYLSVREIVTKPAYTDYTWGWALVHFFKSDPKMSKAFDTYFLGLARDRGVKRVPYAFGFMTVEGEESLRFLLECLDLQPEDLPDLDQRFHDYVMNTLKFESALAKEKAAISAMRTGKRLRAERLFKEALEEGELTANGYYQYATMVRWSDKGKAKSMFRKAIEVDPLVGTFYYDLGRLLEDDDADESKRLKALALELDPEVDSFAIDIRIEASADDE